MLTTRAPAHTHLSRRRGQAMVEFLPAILIFVTVMSAGLAYFRVMRAAAEREEALRNLAFAKIDNAGTLTTLDSPDNGSSAAPITISVEGTSVPALSGQNNAFVSSSVTCFSVIPNGSATQQVAVTYRTGSTGSTPVSITSYGKVCRF